MNADEMTAVQALDPFIEESADPRALRAAISHLLNVALAAQRERIEEAIDLAVRYGGIDGEHHKAWIIDQMVRALADDYPALVRAACAGEDGPDTYDWDIGIAP